MEKAATMKVLANGSWKLPQGRFEEKSHHSKTTNNQKTFLAIIKKKCRRESRSQLLS